MPKNNLPAYVIVELLMRLEQYHQRIGHYKDHHVHDVEVTVKTTGGAIRFPRSLIMQQFESPEQVTEHALLQTMASFKPSGRFAANGESSQQNDAMK